MKANQIEAIFKKIYIKTEADLPKENGWYHVCIKGGMEVFAGFVDGRFTTDYTIENKDIDWYLQPVEGSITAQLNLRDELINYDKWMVKMKWGTDVPSAEKSVDEYLKTK